MLSCVWGVSFLQQTKQSSHPELLAVYPVPTSTEVLWKKEWEQALKTVDGKTDASYTVTSSELDDFPI